MSYTIRNGPLFNIIFKRKNTPYSLCISHKGANERNFDFIIAREAPINCGKRRNRKIIFNFSKVWLFSEPVFLHFLINWNIYNSIIAVFIYRWRNVVFFISFSRITLFSFRNSPWIRVGIRSWKSAKRKNVWKIQCVWMIWTRSILVWPICFCAANETARTHAILACDFIFRHFSNSSDPSGQICLVYRLIFITFSFLFFCSFSLHTFIQFEQFYWERGNKNKKMVHTWTHAYAILNKKNILRKTNHGFIYKIVWCPFWIDLYFWLF